MSIENNNSLPWLNSEYVQTILQKFEGHENVDLKKFSIGSGAEAGQNFAGVIIRVSATYSVDDKNDKSESFILKTSPVAGAIAEVLDDNNTFEAERQMYAIHRDIENLLTGFKIAPKLIYSDSNALVLEDLTSLNFKLADRNQRLNVKEAKLVLEKLARFHAASTVLHKTSSSLMAQQMVSAIDGDQMTPLAFFFASSMDATMTTIRNTPELQQYVPLLENYDIVDEERKVFSRSENDKFHVLNHGDLWLNNIFFKYDKNGRPTESLLVDYQESWWGSPALDLNHFLYTSCDFDVHLHHFDELIEYYHEHLVMALKQLNHSQIPSLDDIRYEVKNKGDQALIALCSIVPVQIIENPEHANPEHFLSDTEESEAIRREVYGNKKFVEILKFFLPKLIERGVLEQTKSHI